MEKPTFTLQADDPASPAVIRVWATIRRALGDSPEDVEKALKCAYAMEAYYIQTHGNNPM
jgi:hypothetical protein